MQLLFDLQDAASNTVRHRGSDAHVGSTGVGSTGVGSTEIDPAERIASERRSHDDGRPWVFANMVTSLDGAATLDGRSGGLGGAGDRLVFSALRAEADVIVVGAETVRAEGYHLARPPTDAVARHRAERGQAPRPRLCIVTRRTHLAGAPPLLDQLPPAGEPHEPWQRPLVATTDSSAETDGFDERLEVMALGPTSVELPRLIARLGEMGLHRVLCEGGPSLLAQLAADDLVDEWDFTIAPLVTGGTAMRPLQSSAALDTRLELDRVMIDGESTMFTRYLTRRDR